VACCCRLYLATGCLTRSDLRGKVFIEPWPSNRSVHHNTLFVDRLQPHTEGPDQLYMTHVREVSGSGSGIGFAYPEVGFFSPSDKCPDCTSN
jgi:hypothetical protein